MPQRINLWSSPRNISTALMYSFGNRPDTAIVDEPLYAHYLRHQPTEAVHPLREEILASQENNGNEVVRQMLEDEYGSPVVVFKQMTHHLIELDRAFLGEMRNVLLIRNPREILRSFSQVVKGVSALDVGVPQQLELFDQLRQSNSLSAVVDARLLLENPAAVLSQLSERLDLPFTRQMLSWEPGPRKADGVWAPQWYKNVHQSTGFQPYQKKVFTLSADLEALAESLLPAYNQMRGFALR